MNQENDAASRESEDNQDKMSRRKFLKYSAGVTAVAVGGAALMGKLPLPVEQSTKAPAANNSSEPIVATVTGDQVTVMNGQTIVKTRDSGLAAAIAEKVNAGN